MTFKELSKNDQRRARNFHTQLIAAGIQVPSAGKVAEHLDAVAKWDEGGSLAALLKVTGWTKAEPEQVETPQDAQPEQDATPDPEAAVTAAAAGLRQARQALQEVLRTAHDNGVSANRCAELVQGTMSRPTVLRVLRADEVSQLHARALEAIRRARLDGVELTLRGGAVRVAIDTAHEADATESEAGRTLRLHGMAVGVVDALKTVGIGVSTGGIAADRPADALACGDEAELYALAAN